MIRRAGAQRAIGFRIPSRRHTGAGHGVGVGAIARRHNRRWCSWSKHTLGPAGGARGVQHLCADFGIHKVLGIHPSQGIIVIGKAFNGPAHGQRDMQLTSMILKRQLRRFRATHIGDKGFRLTIAHNVRRIVAG